MSRRALRARLLTAAWLALAPPWIAMALCSDDIAVDADGDGFAEGIDCNDQDPSATPGAVEVPEDGVDNDCDPRTPDGRGTSVATAWSARRR